MKAKIITSFLIYGLVVGILSVWWDGISDTIFPLNIPEVISVMGLMVWQFAISEIQAHPMPITQYLGFYESTKYMFLSL